MRLQISPVQPTTDEHASVTHCLPDENRLSFHVSPSPPGGQKIRGFGSQHISVLNFPHLIPFTLGQPASQTVAPIFSGPGPLEKIKGLT